MYKRSELKRKMEKCVIFRFIAIFSSIVNNTIHKIKKKKTSIFSKLEKCTPSQFGLKLGRFLRPGKSNLEVDVDSEVEVEDEEEAISSKAGSTSGVLR